MLLTRTEMYMIWNSIDQRKETLEEEYNEKLPEYEALKEKVEFLIKQGRDIQVIDRVWED